MQQFPRETGWSGGMLCQHASSGGARGVVSAVSRSAARGGRGET